MLANGSFAEGLGVAGRAVMLGVGVLDFEGCGCGGGV